MYVFGPGIESIPLMLRSARTSLERQVAFRTWLDLQQLILAHALPSAIGVETPDGKRLRQELAGICAFAFTHHDEREMAEQEWFLTWLSARVIESEPLLLLASPLACGFEFIKPWLAASVDHPWLDQQWTHARELFEAAKPDELSTHLNRLMTARTKQVLALAELDDPRPRRSGLHAPLKEMIRVRSRVQGRRSPR
ncbi:MAG: hypothetical protein WBV82_10365 [Myxococcaceae bacterium]